MDAYEYNHTIRGDYGPLCPVSFGGGRYELRVCNSNCAWLVQIEDDNDIKHVCAITARAMGVDNAYPCNHL